MSSAPKVFIGMPVYNGERFLREALDSIVRQSFADWRLFISDDTSSDSTAVIAQEYAKKDPRIQYYRQPTNLGLFENFRYTLDQADAPYFIWAAQDDIRDHEYLKTCVDALDADESLGLATTCSVSIDSKNQPVLEETDLAKLSGKPSIANVARYILQPEILGKCNLMYGLWRTDAARATWKAYPQRKLWGQDYMFALALVARFGVHVDPRMMFRKRFGGYSNVGGLEEKRIEEMRKIHEGNPKDHMFPFFRFKKYLAGHMEALKGTPYRPLAAALLAARLPRAFIILIKERLRQR